MRLVRVPLATILVALCLGLGGCGDDDAVTQRTATATTPEQEQGGAGDERGNDVPISIAVSADELEPSSPAAPAFLTLALRVRSADGEAHRLELATEPTVELRVPASGEQRTAKVEGQQPGRYALRVDGRRLGTLVVER